MPYTVLNEELKRGLRPDSRTPHNTGFLEQCDGGKPTEFGIVDPLTISNLYSTGITEDWPYPQIFKTDKHILVVDDVSDEITLKVWDGSDLQVVKAYEKAADTAAESLNEPSFATVVNWDFTDGNWANDSGDAVKSSGGAGYIEQTNGNQATPLVENGLYKIQLEIDENNGSGSAYDYVSVFCGTNESTRVLPKVDTIEFVVQAGGGTPTFKISGGFDADFRIASASVKQLLDTSDGSYPDSVAAASTDPPFHIASFGEIWLLTNGVHLFYCSPINGTAGAESPLQWSVTHVPASDLKIGSVADHLGRFYASGFNSADSHYDTNYWTDAFELWQQHHKFEITYETFQIDENVVFFSRPFGGDFWWPLAVELNLFGLPDTNMTDDAKAFYNQAFRERSMGFFRLPVRGECLRILPMGDMLVFYCEEGVASAQLAATDEGVQHVVRKVSDVGIMSKGAVVDGRGFHSFVDSAGIMWILNNDMVLRRLDYSEFLSGYSSGDTLLMTYEPIESDIYIGDGTTGYVRSRSGLGEVWNIPTSIIVSDGEVKSYASDVDSTPSDGKVRLLTLPMDLGDRSHKTLHDVEVGAYDITNLKIRVHYMTDPYSSLYSATWHKSAWFTIIQGGFTIPFISGFVFKLEIEYTPGTNSRLEYVRINWQVRDKRNFRSHQRRAY